ncbi:MAG: EutN/CcmL family microcompartment protein [Ruminococcaceae bacterium]|nr:EutN/CcmL family microcompartment protein [Oscillospiraceae bacterium]
MMICKVIGNVWATKKDDALEGKKLMVVIQTDTYGEKVQGECFVAADIVGAGVGERVLIVNGSTARKALGGDDIPIDAAIVGIIDTLEVDRTH